MVEFLFWVFALAVLALMIEDFIYRREQKRRYDDIERYANDRHPDER